MKYFVGKLSGMFLFIFSCTCAPEALKIFPMVSPPGKDKWPQVPAKLLLGWRGCITRRRQLGFQHSEQIG